MLFIRAHKLSTAGYSYGNSFAVRDKLNTDPNLTPNPIRTHDRKPNPNRPTRQKSLHPVGVELVTLRQNGIIQPDRSTTELSKHSVRSAAK